MNERRGNLRPDLERLSKGSSPDFHFRDLGYMSDEVVENAISQWSELSASPRHRMRNLALDCLLEIERLHNVPSILKKPPNDIDAIWVVGAPGLLLEHGSKPGWSSNFPWMDNLEWENFGSAFALDTAITARRIGKPVNEVARRDTLESGPWLIYNDPAYEPVEIILDEDNGIPIPLEKTLIYGDFIDSQGNLREIKNTVDQIDSIRMPVGVEVRKIAICVLAAQMVRLGRLLARTNNLPEKAEILIVPTSSPVGYEREHAIIESQGAVINVFKHHIAEEMPIKYLTA